MLADASERGTYGIGAVAYLASSFLSSVGFVVFEFGKLDLEKAGLIGTAVALFALIPFLLVKMVLCVFSKDGPASHGVGGAFAGVGGFLLLLSHGEAASATIAAFFGAWGALAGLIYWCSRELGRRLMFGAKP
jgi:hypothetical protein